MRPYYERAGITLYHADCLELLPTLEAGSVDAVVTDPPYGVGIDYGVHDDRMTPDQWEAWARLWLPECRRVATRVLITGQGRLPQLARIEPWDWLLQWWKPAAMGRSPVGFNEWEPIALYGKGSNAGLPDVIRCCIVPQKDIGNHPCPKPLGWAIGQLNRFPKASSILDPFAGTGTVGVASWQLGKKCTLIEINEEYCELGAKRLDNEIDRGRLFPPEAEPAEQSTLEFE